MQFSWILFVKQIFNECGFSNIWETELFDNVDYCPVSMGSLLFVVLNLQSKIASFISKIFKYSSYLNSVLNVL
jgi:hypothetical protein